MRPLALPGFAAVWVCLYCGACAVFIAQTALGSAWAELWAYAYCTLVGAGVFLLDRAKVWSRAHESGDAPPADGREAFVTRWAVPMRIAAAIALLAASTLGATRWWALVPIPAIAAGCAVLYGGLPGGAGVRRWLVVKNLFVAGCLGSLGAIAVLGQNEAPAGWIVAVWALGVRVFADSIACDIADAPHDAEEGVATVPVVMGAGRAWAAVLVCDAAGATLLAIGLGVRAETVVWGLGALVTTPLIAMVPGAWQRDLIDLRLTLLAPTAAIAAAPV